VNPRDATGIKSPGKVWVNNDPEPGELPVYSVTVIPTSDGEGIVGVY